MNKKEAKNKLIDLSVGIESNQTLGLALDVIEDIYADFEKQTCENCKHIFRESMGGYSCRLKVCEDSNSIFIYNSLSFGCNKWEAKKC